jgi:hypothetical protein
VVPVSTTVVSLVMFAPSYFIRHCKQRSDEAIQSFPVALDCFAELVIGRAFARPGGSQ